MQEMTKFQSGLLGRHLKLIAYSEAKEKIMREISGSISSYEIVPTNQALGRICLKVVKARNNIPKRSVSAMDGYAILSSMTKNATPTRPASFRVESSIYPETTSKKIAIKPSETCYVATGSHIPRGSDSVVRVEQVRIHQDSITVPREVVRGANIEEEGSDVREGQVVAIKGDILSPAKIALLISAGIKQVKVGKVPLVGILSIGNELRTFEEQSSQKKINNYADLVAGFLVEFGAKPVKVGISKDDPSEINNAILKNISRFDMMVTIGGSSVGERDFTVEALSKITNSKLLFHGLRIVPIRPAGLALIRKKPVVILPGNAVSVALSFFLVVLPVLNSIQMLTLDARQPAVVASSMNEFSNDRAMDALYLVSLVMKRDGYHANPLRWGSNLALDLARANGFVRLSSKQTVKENEKITVSLFGNSEFSRIPKELV